MNKPYNWTDEYDTPVKTQVERVPMGEIDPDDESTYKCHCGRAKPCRRHKNEGTPCI